uniref:Uncharacterized protein n=1 Tax=Siphoviridae sp. ctINK4 TaxID=2825428 RepID=A0A8S5NXU6_9CAUD|nr:MAG TPA: hypothetical protein [Siphoviridae sp. ctINK4]
MKAQITDVDDLVISANNIENAMKGLESFVYHNMSSTDVTLEGINGLSGLVEAISCLAERHSDLCRNFIE